MSDLSVTTQLSARTERAVAAAVAAGRELGIEVRAGRVLHDVFSVLVELEPSPVVVRVPVVLPPGTPLDVQRDRQQRELDVVAELVRAGARVIPPSPLVPLAPVQRDGFSMTFWQLVKIEPGEHSFTESAAPLAAVHAALARQRRELPFLSPLHFTLRACFDRLAERPDLLAAADLERAERQWRLLEPICSSPAAFAERHPRASIQVVHGDAPYYNIVWTPSGPLISDFEDTTLGPVEWDLAFAGPEVLAAYDEAAREAGIRVHDPAALRTMEAARMLQSVACFALVPELPILKQGLTPFLEEWRASDFAAS